MTREELAQAAARLRQEREAESALSRMYPGVSHYDPPESLPGKRVARKPRLDEMDGERQT